MPDRKKVSVIGALNVPPRSHQPGFYFATAADGYFSAEKVVAFLRDLLVYLGGKVVIWDGGGNHKRPVTSAFLMRNRRLTLVWLPAYAPDLNPVEVVWSRLKWADWPTSCPTTRPDWTTTVRSSIWSS